MKHRQQPINQTPPARTRTLCTSLCSAKGAGPWISGPRCSEVSFIDSRGPVLHLTVETGTIQTHYSRSPICNTSSLATAKGKREEGGRVLDRYKCLNLKSEACFRVLATWRARGVRTVTGPLSRLTVTWREKNYRQHKQTRSLSGPLELKKRGRRPEVNRLGKRNRDEAMQRLLDNK